MVDAYYIVTLNTMSDSIDIKLYSMTTVLDFIKLLDLATNPIVAIQVRYIRVLEEKK